jgi:hypothetical protein
MGPAKYSPMAAAMDPDLGGCKFAAAASEMATTTPLVRNIGIALHVALAISGHHASLWYTRAPQSMSSEAVTSILAIQPEMQCKSR